MQLANASLGKQIIFRECLIEGPISQEIISLFWEERSRFISLMYAVSKEEYFIKTVEEFKQINQISEKDAIFLWFEDDLFCQLNMWFIISQLNHCKYSVFRVFPPHKTANQWDGFSRLTSEELMDCMANASIISIDEMSDIQSLWRNIQQQNFKQIALDKHRYSGVIRHFESIFNAYIEQITDNRPLQTLKKILNHEKKTFQEVLVEFNEQEGIYGMGDTQIRNILHTADLHKCLILR